MEPKILAWDGAWISPKGEIIWVGRNGEHRTVAQAIIKKYPELNQPELDEYETLFHAGFVRYENCRYYKGNCPIALDFESPDGFQTSMKFIRACFQEMDPKNQEQFLDMGISIGVASSRHHFKGTVRDALAKERQGAGTPTDRIRDSIASTKPEQPPNISIYDDVQRIADLID